MRHINTKLIIKVNLYRRFENIKWIVFFIDPSLLLYCSCHLWQCVHTKAERIHTHPCSYGVILIHVSIYGSMHLTAHGMGIHVWGILVPLTVVLRTGYSRLLYQVSCFVLRTQGPVSSVRRNTFTVRHIRRQIQEGSHQWHSAREGNMF